MGCPLLDLPGELRNRIYNYTVEEGTIKLYRKPNFSDSHTAINRQFFSLTQACRSIRSELAPLYRARTKVSVTARDLYQYINTFLAPPGISDTDIIGFVTLDLTPHPVASACIDIKPLLQLLRRARNLHVGTSDIITLSGDPDFGPECNDLEMAVQQILVELYDIHDMEIFYDYMDDAMTVLELECDHMKGVEIVFELGPAHWEAWMGEWSKPDHDPDYRIPIELEDRVVDWGRQCGMELDRAMGSPLTVNFRRGR